MILRLLFERIESELARLTRFGIVGILATIAYYGAAQSLDYLQATPFAANLMAYAAGTTISFCGHFFFTFGRRSKLVARLVRFMCVSVSGYALSHLIVYVMLVKLGYPFWLATLVVALTLPIASWVASRYWAFA